MFCDYHLHSHFSDDSSYQMEEVVKDAIAQGLEEICFTDHVDYGVKPDWDNSSPAEIREGKEIRNVNYPLYFQELRDLQNQYAKQISIKKGLEFGIQSHTVPEFKKLARSYDLDFVLLSIHQVENQEFWTNTFQEGRTDEECYDRYYRELLNVVGNFQEYSVLAHMDLIRRYLDKEKDCFSYNQEIIREILKKVIADGKGIELNTSSVRYQIDGLTPSIEILKAYRSLGGEIITMGSDSHEKNHLGAYIKKGQETLKNLGFKYICTFSQMKPQFHLL